MVSVLASIYSTRGEHANHYATDAVTVERSENKVFPDLVIMSVLKGLIHYMRKLERAMSTKLLQRYWYFFR